MAGIARVAAFAQELQDHGVLAVDRPGIDGQRAALADREAEVVGVVAAPAPSISPKRPQRNVANVASSVQSERMVTWPEVGKSRVVGQRGGIQRFLVRVPPQEPAQRFAVLVPGGFLRAELLHPRQPEAVVARA